MTFVSVTDRETGKGKPETGEGDATGPTRGRVATRTSAGAREAEGTQSHSVAELKRLPESLTRRVGSMAPDGCVPWTGPLTPDGYGSAYLDETNKGKAHRVVYVALYGRLPAGLAVDHLCCYPARCEGGKDCPHRRCVNPEHLEPKTSRENTLRGSSASAVNARATHCVNGHAFDAANTRLCPDGRRACRACVRRRAREIRARRPKDPLWVPPKDRSVCPQGHPYTVENTKISTDGKRSCRTCANARGCARRARNSASKAAS